MNSETSIRGVGESLLRETEGVGKMKERTSKTEKGLRKEEKGGTYDVIGVRVPTCSWVLGGRGHSEVQSNCL